MSRRFELAHGRVLMAALLLAIVGCRAQWNCAIAPNGEFEVGVLGGVIETSEVAGTLFPVGADEWLESNKPTVSIWRDRGGELVVLRVDVHTGRFAASLPDGRYCFRASASGFNSVIGRIVVRRSAPARQVDLRLTVSN